MLFKTTMHILLSAALLISCVGVADKLNDELELYKASTSCCDSFRQFDFQQVHVGESIEIEISSNSPAFIFEYGKSYYKAFKLPQSSKPYYVMVDSYILENSAFGKTHVRRYSFYPTVITLDDNFEIVRRITPASFRITKYSLGDRLSKESWSALPYRVSGLIPFTRKYDMEKYLVVLTEAKKLHDTFTVYPQRYMKKNIFNQLLSEYGFEISLIASIISGHPELLTSSTPVLQITRTPVGALNISFVRGKQIFPDIRSSVHNMEEATLDRHYGGAWFDVLPPQEQGYRFAKNSPDDFPDLEYPRYLFSKVSESGGIATAFVQSEHAGANNVTWEAEPSLNNKMDHARYEHSKNISDIDYTIEKLKISGASCAGLYFEGRYIHDLPIRGYDIYCVPPSWSKEENPIVVRIGASYLYPYVDLPATFPVSLDAFYRNVHFKTN